MPRGRPKTIIKPAENAPLPERLAYRGIAEAIRDLVDPYEIGKALLLIFSGVDPFEKKKPNPDNLPTPKKTPLDMSHRMAAIKLFLEYGYGKPLQGVVVAADIRATQNANTTRNVRDLRQIVQNNPEAKAALKVLASAMVEDDHEGENEK